MTRPTPLVEALAALPAAERPDALVEHIRRRAISILFLPDETHIPAAASLFDYPLDSLKAVELSGALQSDLGLALPTSFVFDHPRLETLAAELLPRVLDPAGGPAPRQEDEGQTIEPIAIVGMACRFPGGVRDPEGLYRLQVEGGDAITEVPPDRWDIERYYDPDPAAVGKMYARWGGWLEGIDLFDASFFGISPREAVDLAPEQRLVLEASYLALEDAGASPDALRGSATGVFVGARASEYCWSQNLRSEAVTGYRGTGTELSCIAGRVSYTFGMVGPAFALDTACSSSLVSLHEACESLRLGESDGALAGGVNVILSPISHLATCRAAMLSRSGRCRSFSADADGYVRSEGVGMVYLKRLSDAVRDRDRIRAVIRGSAINQDGASGGLTVPHGPSQTTLLRRALARASLRPEHVGFVQAHGTGTALGDPIEVTALGEVFSESHDSSRPLRIGSIKATIGHAEAAAGIAGLIVTVVALERGVIPPQLHFDAPNPYIPWQELPFEVPTRPTPWPDGPRFAGVSSFGFSGTNAHIVLEGVPATGARGERETRTEVLTLSAESEEALTTLAAAHADLLEAADAPLAADVCHTANVGRARRRHRLAIVATDAAGLAARLRRAAEGGRAAGLHGPGVADAEARLAFAYSGQGSQRHGMGRELYERHPVFRETFDRVAAVVEPHTGASLAEILWGTDEARIDRTDATQPALFAWQVSLTALLESWGRRPDAVMGHSIGEYAAAWAAGVLELDEAARLIAVRGALMASEMEPGAMLAVLAPGPSVERHLEDHAGAVSLAARNGPESLVLSGPTDRIDGIAAALSAEGVRHKRLPVSHAFHSPMTEAMLPAFRAEVESTAFRAPTIPFFSTLLGRKVRPGELQEPDYWVRQIRETVLFAPTLRKLVRGRFRRLLEMGPQGTLTAMATRADVGRLLAIPTLRGRGSEIAELSEALATLSVEGLDVDWQAVDAGRDLRIVSLPTYPFHRRSFWVERSPFMIEDGAGDPTGSRSTHPLLGEGGSSSLLPGGRHHRSRIAPEEPGYLGDHRVFGKPLFPAAGYVELALASIREAEPERWPTLEDVRFERPLFLSGPTAVETLVIADEGGSAFEILAEEEGRDLDGRPVSTWKRHASGRIPPTGPASSTEALPEPSGEDLPIDALYEAHGERGLGYGPRFRTIRRLRRDGSMVVAELELSPPDRALAARHAIHPALLDGAFHSLGAFAEGAPADRILLPLSIDRVRLLGPAGATLRSFARRRESEDGELVVDFRLDAPEGPVLAIEGFRLARTDRRRLVGASFDTSAWVHEMRWVASPGPEPEPLEGTWLVRSGEPAVRRAVVEGLAAAGARTIGDDEDPADLRGVVYLPAPLSPTEPDPLAAEEGLDGLVRLLATTPVRSVLVVTRGAQAAGGVIDAGGVTHAGLWGLVRVQALENPTADVRILDLDPGVPFDPSAVVEEVGRPATPDFQIALRGGERLAARLRRGLALTGDTPFECPEGPFVIRTSRYGSLEHLTPRPLVRPAPGPGEIEVEVHASALNLKDVLFALGHLEWMSRASGIEEAIDQPLGLECAGVVTAVGQGVDRIAVGDRVMASATAQGTLATHVVVPDGWFLPMPDRFDFAHAAGLPTVYLTAMYGLLDLARLSAGDSLLIHAAAGGVGQAAIQVARSVGAEIYATASRGKQGFLRRQGIEHVFDSRTLDFSGAILEATGGRGVSVVLNSLAGEFIERSFDCLAEGGRFVEIGQTGIRSTEEVAALRPDAAYHAFEMSGLLSQDRPLARRLCDRLVEALEAGTLDRLPTRVYEARELRAAFRYLQAARNIGKVVIDFTPPARRREKALRPDRTYWITGGLGGLGRALCDWMVDEGAGRVVLSGRSEPDEEATTWLADRKGRVAYERLDVADAEGVESLVERLGATDRPLEGIVHAAGILQDATIANLDRETLARVLAPKVAGGLNLYRATRDRPLRFCAHFASMVGLLGSAGQGAYASANAFLDGLAQLHASEGGRAIAIDWGPWLEEGMVARMDEGYRNRLGRIGVEGIATHDGLALFERSLGADRPQVGLFRVDGTRLAEQPAWSRLAGGYLRALAANRPVGRTRRRQATRIREQLRAAPAPERASVMTGFLAGELALVLGLGPDEPLDVDADIARLGIDSLMATELRSALQEALETEIPAATLYEHRSVSDLGAFLAGRFS